MQEKISWFANVVYRISNILSVDKIVFMALIALTVVNLLVQYSANDRVMSKLITDGIYLAISFILLFIVANINLNYIKNAAVPFYIVTILLLIGVLLFGVGSHGAKRWLNLGIRIQPSELCKLSVPLVLAYYFSLKQEATKRREYFYALLLILLPVGLIVKQPDLGTGGLVFAAGFFIMFLVGFPWRIIIIGLIILICSSPIAWHFMHSYQQHRVLTLFNPQADPLGKGYHIIQGIIAIGSGGLYGKGYLQGTQTHLDFIPEKHTDFVITVIAEEFGYIGVCVVLFIYLVLILRGLRIMQYTHNIFSKIFVGGFILSLMLYVLINMGMVAGILPVVGVPLPLISYGGTATIVLMLGFGILLAIARQNKY
jgi:rod shape determining protein RodA